MGLLSPGPPLPPPTFCRVCAWSQPGASMDRSFGDLGQERCVRMQGMVVFWDLPCRHLSIME